MINNFLKHKFLFIFCFFILFVCFCTNVKATSKTLKYNGITYDLPSDFTDSYYILAEANNQLHLLSSNSPHWGILPVGNDYYVYNYPNDNCYGTMDNRLNYSIRFYNLYTTDFSNSVGGGTTIWDIFGKVSAGVSNIKIHYSNVDIHTETGEVFYKALSDSPKYSITLSTNYTTNAPLIAYSNYFNYSDAKKYECYISTDSKSWTLMNYETFNDTVNNITKFRFNYKIFNNGCYYFKFLNKETNEDYYLSYNVTNIVKNSSNSGFTESGIPQPFCTYERVGDEFVIKTQSFSSDDMQRFRCFYTKAPDNNYSTWDEMSMGSLNNTLTGETEYYFFFTVPKDSEDCTYYFVFYDINSQQYGSPSSMNCYFDKMNEYADSLYPTVSKKNSRFNDLLKYFKERFGFLTYPFEFLVNFANRIFNINYSEPVIHIPELREPFNNDIIFNGLDFNFNSLLNNDTFSYIYNIYLVAVDFIIVVLFIFLCKKEIEEVFGDG